MMIQRINVSISLCIGNLLGYLVRNLRNAVLLGLTGVIWHDMELIAGVFEVLKYLRSIGKKLIFVT